jgi:hypothetical protein
MSKLIFSMMVMAIAITIVLVLLKEDRGTVSYPLMEEKKVSRFPSSLKEEVFKFQKSITFNFDFGQDEHHQVFDGHLFMDWSGLVATVALAMPGHRPDVFIRAHFSEDYSLRCIESPKVLSERDADYVLLLKNLVLDYAFKTNRDDNGDYAALLSIKEQSDGTREAIKSKSKYVDPDKAGITVQKSHHEINFAEKLIEAKGEDHYKLHFRADKSATAKTNYRLIASISEDRPLVNVSKELGECSTKFSQDTTSLTKISAGELKNILSEVTAMNRSFRQDAMRKILKALRADRSLLGDFMDWAHTVKDDQRLSAYAIGILGSLGTPEAQQELIGLFNANGEDTKHIQHQILNALTLSEAKFTAETKDFLRTKMNGSATDHVEGAAYALGAQGEVEHLVAALNSSKSDRSRMIYIDALGNSASQAVVPVLQKYAMSESRSVRERAIEVLERMKAEKEPPISQGPQEN